MLDQIFKPFEDLLVEAVFAGSGGRVLDVGCGTGSTTLAVARLLGAKRRCVGIDISDPMIEGLNNIVDVYVRHLRRKVDDPFHTKLIRTVRGVGYGLGEDADV